MNVKVGLTLKVSRATVTLGKRVIISGAISPAHTGLVTLTIKRGKTVVLTQDVSLSSFSRYKLPHKPKTAGKYSVTAAFAADGDHLGNTARVAFRVVR